VLNGILWILRTCAPWADLPGSLSVASNLPPAVFRVGPRRRVEDRSKSSRRLVHATLAEPFVSQLPARLIGDNAYESDRLDAELARYGAELIAPHRRTRTQRTQDGRPLRRYRRRWKVERLFAWLQNFRRIVVRMSASPRTFSGCSTWPAASSCCGVHKMALVS
jgi:transposase